tara:strand:+ start:3980 stop:4159 length:180 start_codon:yes stop_codon:yes gene_type:complete
MITASDFVYFGASKEEAPLLLTAYRAWVQEGNRTLLQALTEAQQVIVANLIEYMRQSYD